MHKNGSGRPKSLRLVWMSAVVFVFLTACSAARAAGPQLQTSQNPPAVAEDANSRQNTDQRNANDSGRANDGEFHLSRERYEKAVAYSRAGYVLYFLSTLWGIIVLVLLLKAPVVARLRDFAETRSRKWMVQGAIFVPLLFVLLGVAQLPIEMYGHSLSLKYAQSIQGWGSWLWDWSKGEMITVVLGLMVVVILFAVIRKAPKTWWMYFWFVSIPLVLILALIAPWVLDPMFHKFVPLQGTHPQLVANIAKLTQRAGDPIPPERMFLMEASEKSNQINAYVTGIGASKRVVVWDNTIKKLTPDEVLFVVGHEMGHYVLGHVVIGIVLGLLGSLLGLVVANYALQWMLRRWGGAWGVRGQDDWAALAVLLLIASVLGFVSDPIGNGISRRIEHAADVFGLEVIHGIVPEPQETAAQSFQVMGDLDLADPNPPEIITLWLYSHPPLAERLKFARNYDPWDQGKEPKYVK
jgi:STE24 endopeptidase